MIENPRRCSSCGYDAFVVQTPSKIDFDEDGHLIVEHWSSQPVGDIMQQYRPPYIICSRCGNQARRP